MTQYRCPICDGRKYIRLPLRQELAAVMPDEKIIAPVQNAYRDYPCPECSPVASIDKVRVVECYSTVDVRYDDLLEAAHAIKKDAAYLIGLELMDRGYMRFQKEPRSDSDHAQMINRYRASVAVVSSNVAAQLDKEREAAENKFAYRLVEKIKRQIDNWGSYYGNQTIRKEVAHDLINDAMKYVKEHRHG